MKKGTGKCWTIFGYLMLYAIIVLILKKVFLNLSLNREKYDSINYFDCGTLNKIKDKESFDSLDENFLNDLAIHLLKFAKGLGYQIRSKEKENIFPEPL